MHENICDEQVENDSNGVTQPNINSRVTCNTKKLHLDFKLPLLLQVSRHSISVW